MDNSTIKVQQVNEMQGIAAPVVISYSVATKGAGSGTSAKEVIPSSNVVQAVQAIVTISTDGHGTITNPGTGSFIKNLNSVISIVATPNSNYRFSGWSTTGSVTVANTTNASSTATIKGTGTIQANFVATTTVTIASGSNGVVTSPGTGTYTKDVGSSLPIVATPNANYAFSGWTVTGSVTVANASSASTTATINGVGTITANFVLVVSITMIAGSNGTINTPGTGSYNENVGSIISISATPNSSYKFSSWVTTGNIVVTNSTSASTTATINGAGTITANFTLLYSNYWGSGADGAAVLSANTSYTSVQDGDVVVKNYTSLTINSGVTVTTSLRCKGLVIYVNGNCTINGTLTMTARGAYVNPTTAGVAAGGIQFLRKGGSGTYTGSNVSGCGAALISAESNQAGTTANGTMYSIPLTGAAGGVATSASAYNGNNGTAGSNGQTGGGGSGGAGNKGDGATGYGTAGTCFSGGSGGSGQWANSQTVHNATAYGGPGGSVVSTASEPYCGGGSGNNGGTGGGTGANGNNGTGGLLVLFVSGTLTVGSTGVISANGVQGGNGRGHQNGAPGGGTGGGSVLILYGTSISNSGTIQAVGGAGGTPFNNSGNIQPSAGAGGAGSVRTYLINP